MPISSLTAAYRAIFVIVVVVVVEVIGAPRILSDPEVHRFSDCDNDNDNECAYFATPGLRLSGRDGAITRQEVSYR